jgi:hypothetical protein
MTAKLTSPKAEIEELFNRVIDTGKGLCSGISVSENEIERDRALSKLEGWDRSARVLLERAFTDPSPANVYPAELNKEYLTDTRSFERDIGRIKNAFEARLEALESINATLTHYEEPSDTIPPGREHPAPPGREHPASRSSDVSHIDRVVELHSSSSQTVGGRVFIGHGRSSAWRELKDFIADTLHLPWDEFNRVEVAGMATTDRLQQMLDQAAVAFLVLTAEDEQADGKLIARQNVIHEAGLFQGRLGFKRAILMLEEGTDEFSNIHGLSQLRFPAGYIRIQFEGVRQVLKREGLIP